MCNNHLFRSCKQKVNKGLNTNRAQLTLDVEKQKS